MRAFLGQVGYYRKFLPSFSAIATPLTDATKKEFPDKVDWTEDCECSFTTLKQVLCTQVLRAPDYEQKFLLQTDATNRGIGAVLAQKSTTGVEHPIAYYYRKMLPRESRYSATEQEGFKVCKHFLPYLLGRHFTIQTDQGHI